MAESAFALTSTQVTLGKIEDSLYGFQYNDENNSSRLNRIENSVYGKVSTESESNRIAKLRKDIAADEIGEEIPPVEDTFAQADDYIIEEEPQETSDVSYPVIDEMEEKIFNKTNKTENIKIRLSKLEENVFHKTYNDDLSTRVDRLRAEINPTFANSNSQNNFDYTRIYDDSNYSSNDSYHLDKYVPPGSFDYEYYNDRNNRLGDYYDNDYSSGFGGNSYSSRPPKKVSISTIEKKLYKQAFNSDSIENRLNRVENSMFGTMFPNDNVETRIERISSAYQAEKSAGKYDSNKFTQNLATAMQIGTLILMVLACIL